MCLRKSKFVLIGITSLVLAACATEGSRVVETPKLAVASTHYAGEKISVSVGRFNNQSAYNAGIFGNGEDRLGGQAQTILITSLQQSGRFAVLDRSNLKVLQQESQFSKAQQSIQGARYVITGDVVEFGRKTTGDHQLFGILGKGKKQVAHARVNLNVVDVQTSGVVYSTSGAGEYSLSNREVVGFGGSAGYDATLNDKVLSLAIAEAVNNLAVAVDNGQWSVR